MIIDPKHHSEIESPRLTPPPNIPTPHKPSKTPKITWDLSSNSRPPPSELPNLPPRPPSTLVPMPQIQAALTKKAHALSQKIKHNKPSLQNKIGKKVDDSLLGKFLSDPVNDLSALLPDTQLAPPNIFGKCQPSCDPSSTTLKSLRIHHPSFKSSRI